MSNKTSLTPERVLAEALRRFENWVNNPEVSQEDPWFSIWLMSDHEPNEPDIHREAGLNIYLRQSDGRPVPDGFQYMMMLEIGNFNAADPLLGQQFLQAFVREAHLRHPWNATFVSDRDIVRLLGDMSEWKTLDMSSGNNDMHGTYYYLFK